MDLISRSLTTFNVSLTNLLKGGKMNLNSRSYHNILHKSSFSGLSYTPRGFCSHTIFLVGYITAYLLYTGFAAGITSILVGKDINQQITLQRLIDQSATFVCADYLKDDLPTHLNVCINEVKLF